MMDPTLGLSELRELFAWGAGGGLAGLLCKGRRLALPRLVLEEQEGYALDLGFLAPLLAGGIVGILSAGRAELLEAPVQGGLFRCLTAGVYGFAFAVAGPAVLNTLLAPILKRLGATEIALPLRSRCPAPGAQCPAQGDNPDEDQLDQDSTALRP